MARHRHGWVASCMFRIGTVGIGVLPMLQTRKSAGRDFRVVEACNGR
jgi:hypothetical protein